MLRQVCQRMGSLPTVSRMPVRTTVIVKRVHKPPIKTIQGCDPFETPQGIVDKSILGVEDDKYLIYEIEEKFQEDHKVKVILLRHVDNFGVKGQIISVPYREAHRDLLLPGFAVYHSPETLAAHRDIVIPEETKVNSSEYARLFSNMWSETVLDVCMSMDNEWTVEPWHVKAAFRKRKTWLQDDEIEIPGGKICGPDLSLENKEFISIVTINNFEKVAVRCRLHHLTADPDRRISLDAWHYRQAEPVWEHERQKLLDMNRKPIRGKILENKHFADEVKKYKEWKIAREERLA